MHGWLPALANKTDLPFVVVIEEFDRGGGDIINETVIYGGPPTTSKYLTGLVTSSNYYVHTTYAEPDSQFATT